MADPARKRATYQDVLDTPDDRVAEIIDGQLSLQPRPAILHAIAASEMGGDLHSFFRRGRGGPGGWWLLDEPELHLDSDVFAPDLAGWRTERMGRPPRAAFIELAPDWACEILSPSTRRLDRVLKTPAYARHGIPWLWLVDPAAHTIEVLRLQGGQWLVELIVDDSAPVRLPPFDAVELDPSAWFLPDED